MPTDYPREVIAAMAEEAIQRHGGPALARVYFKFTCAFCQARCTFETANHLYEQGTCDNCGQVTEVRKAGFALHLGVLPPEA